MAFDHIICSKTFKVIVPHVAWLEFTSKMLVYCRYCQKHILFFRKCLFILRFPAKYTHVSHLLPWQERLPRCLQKGMESFDRFASKFWLKGLNLASDEILCTWEVEKNVYLLNSRTPELKKYRKYRDIKTKFFLNMCLFYFSLLV